MNTSFQFTSLSLPRLCISTLLFKRIKHMRFRILLIFAAIFTFAGCQKEAAKDTLPSGYEYILHTSNPDGKKAEPGAIAFFRFGMRNDDEVVASNYDAPFPNAMPVPDLDPYAARQLSPPEEAIALMTEGDSLTIIVPLDTIPEAERPQGFETSSFLYYDIKLEEIKLTDDLENSRATAEARVNEDIGAYLAGTLEGVQTTETGLKYIVHDEGSGEQADSADYIYADYYGALLDSSSFDNSFSRGNPLGLQLGMGQVIQGWDEGLALLAEGAKATFFIPSELGYGERGSPPAIPGNSELVFYVEITNVLKPE